MVAARLPWIHGKILSVRHFKMCAGSYRRKYYDRFSRIYDKFVALHSRDTRENTREFLVAKTPLERGDKVLDICTGTGSLLPRLEKKVGIRGLVVGLDFSRGMLEVARHKVSPHSNVCFVEADAVFLPFKENVFDAVTCSHAFYELKSGTQDRLLQDIVRVLKPGKTFVMMEHELPDNNFIRFLLYVRFFSMGAGRAVQILRHEREMLEKYFSPVEKLSTPSGRSKIWICTNKK